MSRADTRFFEEAIAIVTAQIGEDYALVHSLIEDSDDPWVTIAALARLVEIFVHSTAEVIPVEVPPAQLWSSYVATCWQRWEGA